MAMTVTLQDTSAGAVGNGADITLDVVALASFAANVLNSSSDFIEFDMWGQTTHDTDVKRVVIQVGPSGGLVTVFDWTLPNSPANTTDFEIRGRLFGPDLSGKARMEFTGFSTNPGVKRVTNNVTTPWGAVSELTIALQNQTNPTAGSIKLLDYKAVSFVN